jgi:hypothetical protein
MNALQNNAERVLEASNVDELHGSEVAQLIVKSDSLF